MKTIFKGVILLVATLCIISCNDDFMDRPPRHMISPDQGFKNPQDLETYTNGLYKHILFEMTDNIGDNTATCSKATDLTSMLYGDLSPVTVSSSGSNSVWDWSGIREVNLFLDNCDKATGDEAALKHYIGIVHFFRAKLYYDKVKKFGDVPWYEHYLTDKDMEALMKPMDSRDFVVGKIMEDLEYAYINVKDEGTKTCITNAAVATLYARIALHEGTFRKYHGLNDATKYLEKAAEISEALITNSAYSLHKTANTNSDYTALFSSHELKDKSEVLLYRQHILGLTQFTAHIVLDFEWGISRDLIDSYLMTDGTRFTDVPGYKTLPHDQIFIGRDARLRQTSVYPGWQDIKYRKAYIINPMLGGFGQNKFYPSTADECYYYACLSSIPMMRLAESMLIFAEAKAELGTLTDGDLDISINLLRKRAGITTGLTVAGANANVDPIEAARYPNISGANLGAILEIRRERRIELAGEGFRYDDVIRWKRGELLTTAQEGMYFPALGAYDVTGDGILDMAILADPASTGPIAHLTEQEQKDLAKYYLKDSDGKSANYYLSNTTSGAIRFVQDRDAPRQWNDKYYYWPIPQNQILLNPNLKQPGW